MSRKHIWIVEYGVGENWEADAETINHEHFYITRDEAMHAKEYKHTGHHSNLRVRKYVREER